MAQFSLSEAEFTQQVNVALKNYHSVLALARSPLANSPLVTPLLVLDDVSPTADERGHALRLVLQWSVGRLAPGPLPYPLGIPRPYDDPTWRDPQWWRYNILRHRYLEPLHPDEFVEGGRASETLIALTGIPSSDTFFDERNRAVRAVAQSLRAQLTEGSATAELQQLALDAVYRPLQSQPAARALLGIAATFGDLFPRALLLLIAAEEQVREAETALTYLTLHRFLLLDDGALALWLSPVLQRYVYAREPVSRLRIRHGRAGDYYRASGEPLKAARHYGQAHQWQPAATLLLACAPELINELQIQELIDALLLFKAHHLPPALWRETQILLSDLLYKSGRREEAVAACRRALKVTDEAQHQARIYRRMGKLYENHNQLHALGYYQQAVERFPDDDPEQSIAYKDRGWLYILRQEWANAEADLLLALARAAANEGRADVLDALSYLANQQKHYATAIQYAQEALGLREQSGDMARIANSFTNLGLIYGEMGEHQHAIAAHEEALRVYRRLDNRSLVATALLNIGLAHHLAGRLAVAVEHYRTCLTVCQAIGLPLVESKAHSNLVEALADLGILDEARQHWLAGYAVSQAAGFADEMAYFEALHDQFPALAARRAGAAAAVAAPRPPSMVLAPDSLAVLALVEERGRVTPKLLIERLHISKATATRRLAELVEHGLLVVHGKGRGTCYTLTQPAAPMATRTEAHHLQTLRQHEQTLRTHFAVAGIGIVDHGSPNVLVDLLVRFTRPPDLTGFFALERYLGQLLGVRIDLHLEGRNDDTVFWVWLAQG